MQTLYYNGTVLTMEQQQTAEAVLVKGGIIQAVGGVQTLREHAPSAQLVDLHGATLMPSFIDAHSHFSAYAGSFMQVALEGCASFDEIAAQIRRFVAENDIKPGVWVTAKGYDHNALAEQRHPTLALLDACCPKNPLIVQHASGHVGVLNSLALSQLGITADTPAPEGGVIGHENGALTGYLEENAYFFYVKKAPMADIADFMAAFEKAQNKYASYGITTLQEGMMVSQMLPLYQALTASGLLKLDIVGYADSKDAEAVFAAFPDCIGQYHSHLKLGGLKIFLDGSPQGRTAWMRTPYTGQDGYTGYGTMQDEAVVAALCKAQADGLQILAHCNGDAAAQQYINAVRAVPKISALRPVMIHAQLLGLDQLDAVKQLSILPSFFVAHVYHWGDVHIRNFGLQRAAQISPAHSALEKDIIFTFHQDAPVIEPNMLETVWCAASRRTKDGVLLGEQERISVYEALKAVTINAAYQYFEEDKKGSIAPGKNADFVLLSENPLQTPPEALRSIRVLQTIKNGVCVYCAE